MPTIEEIAVLAQVSRSTVSRVVNNDPNVSQATRQHVLDIINRLNFQPNRAARRLAGGRTHILGVVIPIGATSFFSDPFCSALLRGISSTSKEQDYSMMLWITEPFEEHNTVASVLHNGFVDGVILSAMTIDNTLVEHLGDSRLPFLLIGRDLLHTNVNYIDVENRRGAALAVEHLIASGRRRVAAITGLMNTVVGIDRRDGYLDALAEHGLSVDENLIQEGNFTEISGFQAMKRLLPFQPDAVFAASDIMALGAMRALREENIRIPEQVAVAGFDDIPPSAHAEPPLTTIRQPIQRLGSLAAQTLIEMIEHPEIALDRHIVLPVELIVRLSCGAILKP